MKVKEWLVVRQVFPSWSIALPPDLEESFEREGYWHARAKDRRISLTSMLVSDGETGSHPPTQAGIDLVPLEGDPIPDLPQGLSGRATVQRTRVEGMGRTRMLQGVLTVPGRVLIATITTDDLEWAIETWKSIQYIPGSRAERRHPSFSRAGRSPW